MCYVVFREQRRKKDNDIEFPGGYSGEATPVPIPNTEVKLSYADGTWDAGPWKSRSSPGILILDSSTVEYAAVNRGVVGSNPTRGAKKQVKYLTCFLAPRVGFEPTTPRLTAAYSTVELSRIKIPGDDLLFQGPASQVPSA